MRTGLASNSTVGDLGSSLGRRCKKSGVEELEGDGCVGVEVLAGGECVGVEAWLSVCVGPGPESWLELCCVSGL